MIKIKHLFDYSNTLFWILIFTFLGFAEFSEGIFPFNLKRIIQAIILILFLTLIFNYREKFKFFNFTFIAKHSIFVFLFFIYLYVLIITLIPIVFEFEELIENQDFLFIGKRIIHFSAIFLILTFTYFATSKLKLWKVFKICNFLITFFSIIAAICILDYVLYSYGINLIQHFAKSTSGEGLVQKHLPFYKYIRLIGGFKEPSHYAAFFIPILFFSILRNSVWDKILITCSICLTLSFIGYLGLIFGFIFFVIFYFLYKSKVKPFKFFFGTIIGILFSVILVKPIHEIYVIKPDGKQIGYYEHRSNYILNKNILDECLNKNQNKYLCKLFAINGRGHIVYYFYNEPLEIFGRGLGEPYIHLKKIQNSDLYPSSFSGFVSLYFQIGIIGLTFFICFFILIFKNVTKGIPKQKFYFYFPSVVYLLLIMFMFCILIEELTLFSASQIGLIFSIFSKIYLKVKNN